MEENITPIPVEEETVLLPEAEDVPTPEAPKLGMKWHHFLSGWLLWIGGAGILFSLIGIVLYIVNRNMYLPVDLTFLILQNVLTLGICVLVIRAWQDLEHYRKTGPKRYMAQYGIGVTANILLDMIECAVRGLPMFDISILISLAWAALFLHWNAVYFRKRAHLYVN